MSCHPAPRGVGASIQNISRRTRLGARPPPLEGSLTSPVGPADASARPQFEEASRAGWGTWIRTKIDGVRVRSSTVELFPNARPEPLRVGETAQIGRLRCAARAF